MPRWALGLVVALLVLMPLLAIAADPILPGSAAADLAIERKCQLDWPDNYSRRAWCERNQRRGVRELLEPIYDVAPHVADVIRTKCARDWPDNFSQRAWCQKNQIRGAKELKNP